MFETSHLRTFFFFATISIYGVLAPSPLWAQARTPLQQEADRAYQKGMALLREKRYSEALDQFKLLERDTPKLPQGYTGEGITLALSGKPREAMEVLEKALKLDPSYWVAQRELGIVEWHQGLKQQAAENLLAIAKLFPNDAAIDVILGEYESEKKDYESAAQFFAKAPAQVASDPHLSLLAAHAWLKTGRRQEAVHQLESLAEFPNLDPQQKFELGWLLGEAKEYPKAIEILKSPPPNVPHPFDWGYALALAYDESGDYSHAIQTLTALKERGLVRADLFGLLGTAQEEAGNTLAAYDSFRQGIYQFPHDDQCYLNMATLSVQHLNYEVAAQVLTAGIEQLPGDYKLRLTRGVVYTLSHKLADAQADYEEALALAPGVSSAYIALGMCLEDQGKLQDAVRTLQAGIAKQLKDALLYYFLADVLFRQGIAPQSSTYREALEAVQQGLAIDPTFAYGYVQRAKLEMISNQLGAAIDDLEHAQELSPKSQTVLYQLAIAYRRAGRKAEAAKLFDELARSSRERDAKFRKGKLIEIMVAISSQGSQPGH
jgi:tetratricopeptide (TPR) repeat protein